MSRANRMPSLRCHDRTWAEDSPGGWLLCRTLSAILDRGGSDLDIALEFLGERLVGERHSLANTLIRPVFARGLDGDGVLAGGEDFAVVVLAVPDDLVLAGGPGRPRDREEQLLLVAAFPFLILRVPTLEVGEPLKRACARHRDP